MNDTNINLELLQKGAVIAYRLPIEELPIHPKKLWKGRVLALVFDHDNGAHFDHEKRPTFSCEMN